MFLSPYFVSGLGQGIAQDLKQKMAYDTWKQQNDYRLQLQEKQRQDVLNTLLGQQQNGQYTGGLLSKYVNQNPMFANQITAQVYGVQLPQVKPVRPKLEDFKVIDIGNKKIPFLVVNDGTNIRTVVPTEFVKSLSPSERRQFNLARKKYNLEVAKFDWQKMMGDKKFELEKWWKEQQAKNKDGTGSANSAQYQQLKTQKDFIDDEIGKIFKKYNINPFMVDADASNIVDLIAKTNPQDAQRLKDLFYARSQLTNQVAGSYFKKKETQQQSKIPSVTDPSFLDKLK